MRRLLDLRPRPLAPSDRAWIALTVVLGIVGTCHAAPSPRAERSRGAGVHARRAPPAPMSPRTRAER